MGGQCLADVFQYSNSGALGVYIVDANMPRPASLLDVAVAGQGCYKAAHMEGASRRWSEAASEMFASPN